MNCDGCRMEWSCAKEPRKMSAGRGADFTAKAKLNFIFFIWVPASFFPSVRVMIIHYCNIVDH